MGGKVQWVAVFKAGPNHDLDRQYNFTAVDGMNAIRAVLVVFLPLRPNRLAVQVAQHTKAALLITLAEVTLPLLVVAAA